MKIIDIIVLAILMICSVRGGRRGLWLTLVKLFGALAALAVTWFMHPAFKAWLRNEPDLVTGFQKTLLGPFMEKVSPEGAQGVLVKLAEVLNQSELPGFIKRMLLATGDSSTGVMVTLNETALSLISFIVLLLVTILAIQIAGLVLDRFFRLPVLSLFNRLAGTVLGSIEGVFLVWVTLAVLTPWIAFHPEGLLADGIRTSRLTGWLYQHNYLLTLIDFTLK